MAACRDSNGTANLKVAAVSLLTLGWIWAISEEELPFQKEILSKAVQHAFAIQLSEEYKIKILHTQHNQVWLCV